MKAAPIGIEPAVDSATPPQQPQLLGDRAYEGIRDRIITLAIPPGSPLDEEALMVELDVGRTPLREALRRLAVDDLVTVFPRRGTFATETDIVDFADITDLRMVLEGHAVYRASRLATDDDRRMIDELLAELEAAETAGDLERLQNVNAAVHRFIYACARNRYMEETLHRCLNLTVRVEHLVRRRIPDLFAGSSDHRGLLLAIRNGEAERGREMIREHISAFEQKVRAAL